MKRSPQSGQTLAITLFLTTLILTLCVAVIGSILKTTQESAKARSFATLYNAAEAGLGMGQRDVNRAAYYMVNLVWTTRSASSSEVLNTELGPLGDGQPYKIFEYFSKIQNWMGLDAANGWMVLPTASVGVPDKYYDFNHNGTQESDEELGSVTKDNLVPGVHQKFITKSWKTSINMASAPDKELYRYYIRRNTGDTVLKPPSYATWYDDKMPLSYDDVTKTNNPIIKKVYVVSTKPLVRVAVYIRMDLSDYYQGSPICECGPGGTRYHNLSGDANAGSPQYVTRCPNNTVRFLIAAVSESTPDAPSQFAQTNVTVELGRAIRGQSLVNNANPLFYIVNNSAYDPGVFAPVLDPLVGRDLASPDIYPGATVSGMLFRVDPSIAYAPRRIYLYETPISTQPFVDVGNNTIISTNTIFFVGFDGTKFRRYYYDGPKPLANISVPEKNFYYTVTNKSNVDSDAETNNDYLRWDFDAAGSYLPATSTYPDAFKYANSGIDELTNTLPWSVRRSSGYSDNKGKFYIQRKANDGKIIGFTPIPGFGYFASVHTLATGPFPTRQGLLSASVSIDEVNFK